MSFDNLNSYNNKKLNLALLILFTFLALVFTIFLLPLSFLGLAVLPIPATLLILSGRKRDGIFCAILGSLLLFFFDYVLAVVIITIIIGISFIYKVVIIDKNKGIFFSIGSIFLVFCGAVVLYILIMSIFSRYNFVKEFLEGYNSYIDNLPDDPLIKKYSNLMFVEGAQYNAILKQTQNFLRFIPYLFPGIFGVYFIISSVINYSAGCVVFRKYGINIKPLPAFKDWDIGWYYCWGVIVGLVLVLIPPFNQDMDVLIDVIGFNLLIVFGFVYSVLGASVIWGIFNRFKISVLWRFIIFILFGLSIGFILVLPIMGLLDIWINFRKLDRH